MTEDRRHDSTASAAPLAITVSPVTAALAAGSLIATIGVWNTLVSARSVIATALAAVVVAALISGPVEALDRRVPRPAAIVLTLLLVGGAAASIGYVLFDDLDSAFAKLQREAPAAAADLQTSERFGELATDLQLEARVTDAVDRLRDNAKDRAQATAFRFVNYFVGGILAIFLLVYGPRIFEGGLQQIGEDARRARFARIFYRALEEARSYLALEIVVAVVIGLAAFTCFQVLGLPGAVALALTVALGSMVPDVGVVAASVPALLLTAASEPFSTLMSLVGGVIVVQIVESLFAHRLLAAKTFDVGPAVSLLAVLLGFAVYGVGGAIFGFAVAVFVSALIDAVGDEYDGVLLALEEAAAASMQARAAAQDDDDVDLEVTEIG